MEALVKKDISKIIIENKEDIKEVYEFIKNDNKIGYGIIKNNNEDQLQIFIYEDYRSNGYGKLFFGKMLETIKQDIRVKTNDNHMINIIDFYNGKELSRNKGMRVFLIPKKD